MDKTIMQQFMQDYWRFIKQFLVPENSDDWWTRMTSAGDDLAEKYGRVPMVEQMVIGFYKGAEKTYEQNNSM